MKKRILALSLAAAMLVGAMASCTAKETDSPSSAAPAEKKDVKLVMWGAQDDQDYLKAVTDEFVAQYDKANVTIELKVQGEDTAKDEALKDVESAADVYGVALDQIGALADAKAIFEIPQEGADQLGQTVDMSLGKYNGKYYGVPYIAECSSILFYNKSLLKEEDVASLEGILAAETGTTNIAFRFDSAWEDITWFATTGAKAFTDGDRTICDWNNQDCVDMIKYIGTLKATGKVTTISGNDDLSNALGDGTIAAGVIGSWQAKAIKEALGDNYGVAKMPTVNGKQMVTFASGKVYVINAHCADPDAAIDLITWVTNADNQLKRFEQRSALPTASALASNATILADPTAAAELAQFAYTIPNAPIYGTVDYWNTAGALILKAFNGEIAEDAVQGELDTLVKGYKGE